MPSPAVQPLLAFIAAHVGGNPTQYMFERAFANRNLDWRYLTFEISAEDLADAVRGLRVLGFRGGNCGTPYKSAVLSCLDRVEATAAMIGAVNLIRRDGDELVGENTDGKGVVSAVGNICELNGKHLVLFGAGQLAKAVVVEAALAGAASIAVVNRTESHAAELVQTLHAKFETRLSACPWDGEYVLSPETDVVIHATSFGQNAGDARFPVVFDAARPDLLVADVTIGPRTRLLQDALDRGFQTVDGLSMLIEQAAIGFQMWTGVAADRQVLREAVEEFLEL